MNQTTTNRSAGKPAPVTHGKCRLTHSEHASLDECLDHGAVILVIMPEHAPWRDYWCRAIRNERGQIVGYRLETLVGSVEDAAPVYQIETDFGPLPEHWFCSCPDFAFRRGPGLGRCKHCNSLAVAIKNPNTTVEF